jgi:transcriptional regulator with XRE-family HTH domain
LRKLCKLCEYPQRASSLRRSAVRREVLHICARCASGQAEDIAVTFGTTLTRLREEAGLTQEGLAERSGFSRGYIAQLESGYRGERVKRQTVHRLAEALGVEISQLLTAAQLRLHASDIEPADRLTFEDFVMSEPTLTPEQRRMMLVIYQGFVADPPANEAPGHMPSRRRSKRGSPPVPDPT